VNRGRTNASLYDMTSKADEIVTALRLAWDLYSNPAQTRKGMYIYISDINIYIFIYIYIDSVDTKVASVFATDPTYSVFDRSHMHRNTLQHTATYSTDPTDSMYCIRSVFRQMGSVGSVFDLLRGI